MKIKARDVEKIASLARLAMGEDEAAAYGAQLSNILNYIEKLDELDTSDVKPTSNIVGLVNVTRPDEMADSLKQEQALSNAPDPSEGFYRVPKIID